MFGQLTFHLFLITVYQQAPASRSIKIVLNWYFKQNSSFNKVSKLMAVLRSLLIGRLYQ